MKFYKRKSKNQNLIKNEYKMAVNVFLAHSLSEHGQKCIKIKNRHHFKTNFFSTTTLPL